MARIHRIGIICEDTSDFESLQILIKRISGVQNIKCIRRSKDGCSHIISKGPKWAHELALQGCQMLLVVHDLDRNAYTELSDTLEHKFATAPFRNKFISIPMEEIEAWILADPQSITDFFRLDRTLVVPKNTSTISSPKEKIKLQVRRNSTRKAIYINTKHNPQLVNLLSLDLAKARSESFKAFYNFIYSYSYA